jgi:endonuclease/exonuclease/phosphatase (EEP) superfamily protein YafD
MTAPTGVTDGKIAPAAPRPHRRLSRWVAVACWLYLAVALGLWCLLFEADLWWPATIFLFSPRWVVALPLIVLIPAAVLWCRRAILMLGVAALVVAGPVMGFGIPWGRLIGPAPEGFRLRVLTCNMHYRAVDPGPLLDLVRSAQPDVVALQEWTHPKEKDSALWQGWDYFGDERLFLASRYRIVRHQDLGSHSGSREGSIRRYELDTPAGEVTFFSVHLASPREGLTDAVRDRQKAAAEVRSETARRWVQSQRLAEEAAAVRGPLLLAGDFNTPPESALFRRQWADCTDAFSAAGWGLGYTYVSKTTMVRIDHILAGPGWHVERCWVGPDVGSPHRPVVADLIWTGPTARPMGE